MQLQLTLPEIRPVPGYEGRYSVTSDGRVISHLVCRGKRTGEMSAAKTRSGYRKVLLMAADSSSRQVYVHHLVLTAFVGPRRPGLEACHNNGVRHDNRVENLRWDTTKANAHDRERHGTWVRGDGCYNSRFTAADVLEIRRRCAEGESQAAVARELGARPQYIGSIVRRITWAWLPQPPS